MGTIATVTVLSETPEQHVQRSFQMLKQLHALWTRFEKSSDISRINAANGQPVMVSAHTTHLLRCMKEAHKQTDGWFNPTLLPVQHQLGDDSSLHSDDTSKISPDARIFDSLVDVEIIDDHTVRIPQDMSLDAGGIGKGLSADVVVQMLMQGTAFSVCVNIGGDIRVASQQGFEHDWNIDILNAYKSKICTVSLRNGAVATSSSIARRTAQTGPVTHILSSQPLQNSTIRSASVIAAEAMWAEVWTKYVMLAPEPFAKIDDHGLAALYAQDNQPVLSSSHWKEFQL